jgi:hypothetical protein
MAWLDFNWIPATVGFYSQCLFRPANGWDRDKWVDSSWKASPAASILGTITGTVSALDVGETCGNLLGQGSGQWAQLQVNSCSWTWAAQVKIALGVVITLGSAWYLISFIIRCISGVVNRKVPEILEDEK